MSTFNREDAYRVQLPAFEGPLDLLLQLIEREKLDISAISLAQVADQFLRPRCGRWRRWRPATWPTSWWWRSSWCGSSRGCCCPSRGPPAEDDDGIDPAEALAAQLREYKRFKEAASTLRADRRGRAAHLPARRAAAGAGTAARSRRGAC